MAKANHTCAFCGASFVAGPTARFCSSRCRFKNRDMDAARVPRVPCAVCGGRTGYAAGRVATATHPACRPVDHGTSGYDRGCRCPECKAATAARMRAYLARRRAEGRPLRQTRRTETRSCEWCASEFEARKDEPSRFCSLKCVGLSKRKDPSRRQYTPPSTPKFWRQAEARAAKAASGSSGGNKVWVQGACLVCAEQFLSPGAASRYCSKECRAKNRPTGAFGLSWLDRMAVYARDEWTCQICSEAVDYTADPLSDWYPSVDHIVPRSHGGSHDLSNLRTAHRWCNSVRGDLSYYTDADLAVA